MCSEPEAVGGGVSIEYTPSRPAVSAASRSNRKVPSACQRSPHLASRPSSAGLSGTFWALMAVLRFDMYGTVSTGCLSLGSLPEYRTLSEASASDLVDDGLPARGEQG